MNEGRKKSMGFRVLAVALSLAAVLAALEIAARIFGPEYSKFANRSAIYFSNPRGYFDTVGLAGSDTVYGLPYRTTQQGFRLPDQGMDVPGYPPRAPGILVLGDSFTFGRGVRWNDLFTTRLSALLAGEGRPPGVLNLGLVGADADQIRQVYDWVSSTQSFPLVIYAFVLNDFGLSGNDKIVGQDFIDQNNGGYEYDRLRHASALYNFIMHRLDARRLHNVTLKAYLDAFSGPRARKGFETVRAMNRDVLRNKGKLVIVVFPLLYDFSNYPFAGIHEQLKGFAEENQIPLLDLYPAFSRFSAQDLWVHPTDHHPNEKANALAAEALLQFLEQNHLLPAGPTATH